MTPTPDAFHALARSSPWRWRTLHFTYRGPLGVVEAWVRRPGRMLVRYDGREHRVDEKLRAHTVSVSFHGSGPHAEPELPEPAWPQDVAPPLRPDGLVSERPAGWWIQYDDPMWQSYTWVAMLDPVELSHHVATTVPRLGEVNGRDAWLATLSAQEGYEPRCGCCPLLWGEISERDEALNGGPTWVAGHPDVRYPSAYEIALDAQTGVVVRCRPLDGSRDDVGFEVDIHEVDANLDHLFPG